MRLRAAVFIPALLLVLPASTALAGGINLSWNDCGTFGQSVKTFACNSNVGLDNLYASFVAPVPLPQLFGVEITMDVVLDGPTVPSWWDFASPGGCRIGQLVPSADFVLGPFQCADPWGGQAFAALISQPQPPFLNRLRVRSACAMSENLAIPTDDVTEYYAFRYVFRHQKTVGAGSCGGCAQSACLFLNTIKLVQPIGVGDYILSQPIDNQLVGWQCEAFPVTEGLVCQSYCPVPAKNRSWGSIKGLYR